MAREYFGGHFFSVVGISTVVLVTMCLALSACGSPAPDPLAPNVNEDREYFIDPRTNVCWSQVPNYWETSIGVDCTPEVMALVNKQPLSTAKEIVR